MSIWGETKYVVNYYLRLPHPLRAQAEGQPDGEVRSMLELDARNGVQPQECPFLPVGIDSHDHKDEEGRR